MLNFGARRPKYMPGWISLIELAPSSCCLHNNNSLFRLNCRYCLPCFGLSVANLYSILFILNRSKLINTLHWLRRISRVTFRLGYSLCRFLSIFLLDIAIYFRPMSIRSEDLIDINSSLIWNFNYLLYRYHVYRFLPII